MLTNLVRGHQRRRVFLMLGDSQAFVLIETSGGQAGHDEEKISALMEHLYSLEDPPLIRSGVLSQSPAQFASLWALRERIPETTGREGKVYRYDISVPVTSFVEVVNKVRARVGDKVKEVLGYGHVGDGNMHLNVIAKEYTPDIQNLLEPFVYEVVASLRGSISAEHGIGSMKPQHLHYSKDTVSIALMKGIKNLIDERGIMNPGKVLP